MTTIMIDKNSPTKIAAIVGNGYVSSTDISSLQSMSNNLTSCVDRNKERVYELMSD